MAERYELADGTARRGLGRVGSTVLELLAWVLVGASFGELGVRLIEASTSSFPISRTTAIALVIILAVAGAIRVNDFQPTLLAALAYFVVVQVALVWLVLISRALPIAESPLTPWQEVGVHSLAIVVAIVLVFAGGGRWLVRWLRERLRSVLDVPPQEPERDADR